MARRLDAASLPDHCRALPGAWRDHPCGHDHPAIRSGPDRDVADDEEVLDAVEESCRLVVTGLPKRHRASRWETVGC